MPKVAISYSKRPVQKQTNSSQPSFYISLSSNPSALQAHLVKQKCQLFTINALSKCIDKAVSFSLLLQRNGYKIKLVSSGSVEVYDDLPGVGLDDLDTVRIRTISRIEILIAKNK